MSNWSYISESDWQNPPPIFRPAPFWSWNGKLDHGRLCRQVEKMAAVGMGGFFMHSRYGLKTEYLSNEWFECVKVCIEKARQLGIKAYLYDEDRWPSGSAGGNITRNNDKYKFRYLKMARSINNNDFVERIGVFKIKLNSSGALESYTSISDDTQNYYDLKMACDIHTQKPTVWENLGTYIDILNKDAVAEFIRVTHEAYADKLARISAESYRQYLQMSLIMA